MATIHLSNSTFYKNGESGVSNVVGIESKVPRIVRYDFQAPAVGASSVSLRFTDWMHGGGTTPTWLCCCIDQDPNSHANTSSSSPYTCYLQNTGSAYEGSADIILLPNQKYYVWVFPYDHSKYGWVEWPRKPQYATLEATGAAASVLSASAGTLGSSHQLRLRRYSSSATHTIRAVCGSASTQIVSSMAADTYSWVPPIAWAAQNTTGTSVSVTITCDTIIGGRMVGSSTAKVSMDIPTSVVPTCSMQLSDPSGLLAELGSYVQSKSRVQVKSTGAGTYGSWTVGFEVHIGDKKANGNNVTFDLPTAGRQKVVSWVQDSRGRWGSATQYIDVAAYQMPQAEILNVYRCTADGVADLKGDHATVVFNASVTGLVASSARYTLKYRVRGAAYWTSQQLPQYDGVAQVKGGTAVMPADPGLSYECTVEVVDKWPPARQSPYRSLSPAFSWLQINGDTRSIGIGQRSGPEGTISMGMPVICNAPMMLGNLIARKILQPGDDLNLQLEYGCVGITSHADAAKIKNMPVPEAGTVWTFNACGQDEHGEPWTYLTQLFIPLNPWTPIYRRYIYTGSVPNQWTYSDWYSDATAVSQAIYESI